MRDVSVNYSIDNEKCLECDLKPCLDSCPIDSIHLENNVVSLDENCIGCVLCSNACPYDAIHVERVMSEPIRENVPNINTKLCRACGACVNACKSGAIHLRSTGSDDMHSEIDEDKCVRCGYCFRACPTDAIKYGEILPKTIREGKTLCIDQDFCIGCMTCTRVCRSKGAINVGHTNKLPYIDPSYCARCNECLDSCPTYAIEYVEREQAFESFNKIKTAEIAYEILKRDMSKLSEDITNVDDILNDLDKARSNFNGHIDIKIRNFYESEIKKLILRHFYNDFDIEKYTSFQMLHDFSARSGGHFTRSSCGFLM